MTRAAEIWAAHQRKRFMRPDAGRYMRPDAARWLKPNWDTGGQVRPSQPVDPAAIKAERDELLDLKAVVAELKFHLALRAFDRK